MIGKGRTVQVNIMVTAGERAQLEQVAQRLGMSVSATVRWLVHKEVYGKTEPALYETQSAGAVPVQPVPPRAD
jgi:hypothetical protein